MNISLKNLVLIGKNIKRSRKLQDLSQEEVALRAGLGLSYYGRVERGTHNPSTLNLLRIALALNVEVCQLVPKLELILIE